MELVLLVLWILMLELRRLVGGLLVYFCLAAVEDEPESATKTSAFCYLTLLCHMSNIPALLSDRRTW